MDFKTISAYDSAAAEIAELHKGLVPTRIYALVHQYFIVGGKCADIGCGIGRDTSWLANQGFKVVGIDPSIGMLQQARSLFPSIEFTQDSLPFLSTQGDDLYDNVLCSAVIMHLPRSRITDAARNLVRIMRPGGVIILSYRGTRNVGQRESGKLYTSLDEDELRRVFVTAGALLLHSESDREEQRDLHWTNLVLKKSPSPAG